MAEKSHCKICGCTWNNASYSSDKELVGGQMKKKQCVAIAITDGMEKQNENYYFCCY